LLNWRNSDDPKQPSIDKAWDYFEHVVLPRYFVHRHQGNDKFQKAEPGESVEDTKLYPVWGTPEKELGDFGIGVGVYFWTLKWVSYILFLGGIMNIPAIRFYLSEAYDVNVDAGKNWFLQASAICTNTKWVACPTCTSDQWSGVFIANDRFANTKDGQHGFLLVNQCGEITAMHGYFVWLSLIVVIVAILIMERRSKEVETRFDEAAQTTSDYSLQVENPPLGVSYDPEEWKSFFSQFGVVVAVTVAADNEDITRALLKRRIYLKILQRRVPNSKWNKYDLKPAVDAARPLVWHERLMWSHSSEILYNKITELDEQIKAHLNEHFKASQVFVTFETEQSQRDALTKLSISTLDALCNNTSAVSEECLFGGKHIIIASEAPEPNAVRWADLEETMQCRWKARLISSLLSILFIFFDFFLITGCLFEYGATFSGLAVTVMNSISFNVNTFIVSFEKHQSEGKRVSSLYLKANIFKWVNTAVITATITGFADTLSNGKKSVINVLYSIYFFKLINEVIQLSDIVGHFSKFFLAPRAETQQEMNAYFRGSVWSIAKKNTDMTTIVFLTLFYSVFFPSGYFLGAFVLMVQYWTDKYCLLRLWSPKPALGNATEENSRVFIPITILVFVVMSSFAFSRFPYDNACSEETNVPSDYVGNFTAFNLDKLEVFPSIRTNDSSYKYCNQDMLTHFLSEFPAIPENEPVGYEWMTSDQETIARLFGWTSVIVATLVILLLFWRFCVGMVKPFVFKSYEARGKATNVKFSELKGAGLYIPQERVRWSIFPLLLMDSTGISDDHIGWKDPSLNSHDEHNVIFDVQGLIEMVRVYVPPSSSKNIKTRLSTLMM